MEPKESYVRKGDTVRIIRIGSFTDQDYLGEVGTVLMTDEHGYCDVEFGNGEIGTYDVKREVELETATSSEGLESIV